MANREKRDWTPKEDALLRQHVQEFDTTCRGSNRDPSLPEEDAMMLEAADRLGDKWTEIASLRKRSPVWVENRVKNLRRQRELRVLQSIDEASREQHWIHARPGLLILPVLTMLQHWLHARPGLLILGRLTLPTSHQ